MDYARRAQEYYLDTGTRFPRSIIWALGMVKYAAAVTNTKLGLLEADVGNAIAEAALEVARGLHDDKIIVDVFQTGSGTGLNMNVNEVIAGRAAERLGRPVHPNDHVNLSQSSNDTIPTAVRLAAMREAREVIRAVESLTKALESLASREADTIKPGRTHLRDALPVTLGQELHAYADALRIDAEAIEKVTLLVAEVPLGGTAVGTGVNAHPDYPTLAVRELSKATGLPLRPARRKMRPMRLLTDLTALSAAYRMLAIDLWRLSQDLRLMNSGPNTGIGEVEIEIPVAGSSMMPGKVNPVTLEAVMQAASHVIGLDSSIVHAALLGEFELSMGLPLSGYIIHRESLLLREAVSKLADKVVPALKPRRERMERLAETSQALVTVLAPLIGYDRAAALSKMLESGLAIEEAAVKLGLPEEIANVLKNVRRLAEPGFPLGEPRRRR